MSDKIDFVLLPGFQINSTLAEGGIEYVNEHYNCHFIDLPGFDKRIEPTEEPSFEYYAKYVKNEIDKLQLNNYVLAGVSFGGLIPNFIDELQGCKAIVGFEPYLGSKSVTFPKYQSIPMVLFARFLLLFRLSSTFFIFWSFLLDRGVNLNITDGDEVTRTIIETNDSETFIKSLILIFTQKELGSVHKDIPYLLVMDSTDPVLDFEYIHGYYKENLGEFPHIDIEMEHLPSDFSKEFFKTIVPPETFKVLASIID